MTHNILNILFIYVYLPSIRTPAESHDGVNIIGEEISLAGRAFGVNRRGNQIWEYTPPRPPPSLGNPSLSTRPPPPESHGFPRNSGSYDCAILNPSGVAKGGKWRDPASRDHDGVKSGQNRCAASLATNATSFITPPPHAPRHYPTVFNTDGVGRFTYRCPTPLFAGSLNPSTQNQGILNVIPLPSIGQVFNNDANIHSAQNLDSINMYLTCVSEF